MGFTITEGIEDALALEKVVENVQMQLTAAGGKITPTVVAKLAGFKEGSALYATALTIEAFEALPAGPKSITDYATVLGLDMAGNVGTLIQIGEQVAAQIKS